MKSETNPEKEIQIRAGCVVQEVNLLFPREMGGDIVIEPGDSVILFVKQKGLPLTTEEQQFNELWNKYLPKHMTFTLRKVAK